LTSPYDEPKLHHDLDWTLEQQPLCVDAMKLKMTPVAAPEQARPPARLLLQV
jgi:hypothetical protein